MIRRGRWVMLPLVMVLFWTLRSQQHAVAAERSYTLSTVEQEVLREINLARTQPQKYAAFLEAVRPLYVKDSQQAPGWQTTHTQGGRTTILSHEGRRAVDEALAFLRAAKPLPALTLSRGMSLGARDHVATQGPTGRTGHKGPDGSAPAERINRYGQWQERMSENISYGIDNARDMIVGLLIDDGIPERGHRKNIFDTRARVLGVSCGAHATTQIMCVTTFAAGYQEKSGE